MPYHLDGNCVKKEDGSTVPGGCHDTHAEAVNHLQALEANVSDAKSVRSLPGKMSIVKTADGRYRWTSISSNNALDRDGEIVSSQALEMDVYRSKQYGDDSELRVFHIPYSLGGAPDFRAVVDGHLVETGEFYPTDEAKAVADWMVRHPDAPDGSGWGTSIGFRGYTDDQGIYHQIEITERSVLPLSSAANPYTSFSTLKEANMPISKRQSEFLEQMLTDPETRAAATAILEASKQSKALDDAGVQRKETITSVQSTQYAGGPGGVFSTPGASNGKAEGDTPAADAKCADCGHAKSDHGSDGCDMANCDCSGFKAKSVKETPEPPPPPDPEPPATDIERKPRTKKTVQPVAAKPVDKSIADLTLDALAEVIDTFVGKSLVKYTSESPDMIKLVEVIKAQSDAIAEMRKTLADQVEAEQRLKARYETPRMLQDLLASRNQSNVIDDTDPLLQKANAALEDDTSFFSKLGLGKGK